MKILQLKAENIKRLIAVDISPDDNTIIISGNNGAGKSSVLDAIYWALAGAKHIQDKPIREGEDTAYIHLDLGKLIVKRTFTEKGSYLKVETAEGFKAGNPQEVIDKLIGAITFDPLEFLRMTSKHQHETIKNLAGIDFSDLEEQYKSDFEDRKEINRDVKNIQAQVKAIEVPKGIPDQEIDIIELTNKISDAISLNSENTSLSMGISDLGDKINALEEEISKLKYKRREKSDRLKEIEELLISQYDIDKMQDEARTAQETNSMVRKAKEKKRLTEQLQEKQQGAEKLTKSLEDCKTKKNKMVQESELPIEGLNLQGGEVYFNSVPFVQCSSAEQLKVSTAIAMAMNPELRVIRIKDGSLLDKDSLTEIKAMAEEKDFQIWIERVGVEPMSIVIEEGKIKNQTKTEEK